MAPLQLLTQWGRSVVTTPGTRHSNFCDIKDASCNVVHIRRRLPWAHKLPSLAGTGGWRKELRIETDRPAEAVRALFFEFRKDTALAMPEELAADICETATGFGACLEVASFHTTSTSNLKLEVVTTQHCPRWHADHVGLRCLCTYAGAPTWYIENNKGAKRRWDFANSAVSVAGVYMCAPMRWRPPVGAHSVFVCSTHRSCGGGGHCNAEPPNRRSGCNLGLSSRIVDAAGVDERYARQAGPGDLLLLKGHLFPGNYGMGAVHRSPEEVDGNRPRLLLTLDNAEPSDCGCGAAHGADTIS